MGAGFAGSGWKEHGDLETALLIPMYADMPIDASTPVYGKQGVPSIAS